MSVGGSSGFVDRLLGSLDRFIQSRYRGGKAHVKREDIPTRGLTEEEQAVKRLLEE